VFEMHMLVHMLFISVCHFYTKDNGAEKHAITTITLLKNHNRLQLKCDGTQQKWRGNSRMEWEASTLHTTSEHGLSSITTTDAHTSAASSRLNWRPFRFKWTRPFHRKTKSGFSAHVPSHFNWPLPIGHPPIC